MKYTLLVLGLLIVAANALADQRYGKFTQAQLCIAGIATNNGRSVKGIRILSNKDNMITVAYTRDDGKLFGYACTIEGKEIRWRDQHMSQWNKNIKLSYSLSKDGTSLDIRSVVFGEPISKSYKPDDF